MSVVPPSSVFTSDHSASYELAANFLAVAPSHSEKCTIQGWPRSQRPEGAMSNLSFARIMYGTSRDANSPLYGAVSNFPSTISQTAVGRHGISANKPQGATVESILHKLWMALSEKK
jgi:hypothetical protein